MQARILVDGPDGPELAAALRAALGAGRGAGWVISVVRLAPPWWCLNVLMAPGGRLQGWSYVGTRSDLPEALGAAAA